MNAATRKSAPILLVAAILLAVFIFFLTRKAPNTPYIPPLERIMINNASDVTVVSLSEGDTFLTHGIEFSPNGDWLAFQSSPGRIYLWNIRGETAALRLAGIDRDFEDIAFSPDSLHVMAVNVEEGFVTFDNWSLESGQSEHSFLTHEAFVKQMYIDPGGAYLASIQRNDFLVRLWDMDTGQAVAALQGHTDRISGLAFSADGSLLASASVDGTIRVWEVSTGTCTHTLVGVTGLEHEQWRWRIVFSPDERLLAFSSVENTVQLWAIQTQSILHTLHGHTDAVTAIEFSPDGDLLATGGQDETVILWDVERGIAIDTVIREEGFITGLAFHPNGTMLAVQTFVGPVRLYGVPIN